jgi:antitoxin Phd
MQPRSARPRVDQPKRASFTATEAKNEFGLLLERAIQGDAVVITKHDAPKAVLISMEEYNALKNAPALTLNGLTAEFDAMYERMQMPKARAAVKALFNSTPAELGKAAVEAARKRG